MDKNRKIMERIQKVLNKAQGTDNEAEAEMLMAKVQAMLEEHNFTMLDLDNLEEVDPVGTEKHVFKYRVNDSWMRKLSHAVARYYGCETVHSYDPYAKHTKMVSFTGRQSNRETVKVMLPYVKKRVLEEGRKLHKEKPFEYTSDRMAARHIANAKVSQIWVLIRENEARQEELTKGTGTELVPVSEIEIAQNEAFPNLTKGRATTTRTTRAAQEAASKITLNRQTTHNDSKRLAS